MASCSIGCARTLQCALSGQEPAPDTPPILRFARLLGGPGFQQR